MAGSSDGNLTPEAFHLRDSVREERHRDILSSLTARTSVEAIEDANPRLRDPDSLQCHPAELKALVEEWRAFRAAVAKGGEVWAFRWIGSCSSFEGFAVINEGRVTAESVTSVSTWI
jgi:hypothetical protein